MAKSRILISGKPGIGKTTAIKKICETLKKKHFELRGIYTNEVRQDGYRVGFDVTDIISGERRTFANVGNNWKGPKVGKYTVNVGAFESIALDALKPPSDNDTNVIYFIDEIGKMELYSEQFKRAVQTLFSLDAEKLKIVATVPVNRSIPEVEVIRKWKGAMEIVMTNNNRDTLADTIINIIDQP